MQNNKQKGIFNYVYNRPWGSSRWPSDHPTGLYKSLYNATEQYKGWNANAGSISNGSIFNLEYTPSGNLLLAGCERRAIMAFDPLTGEVIHNMPQAHDDAVNCMKFIDSNLFVSCSDDSTTALWDLRNLKAKLLNLRGHSNWVKNVEYSIKEKVLITGAFDGNIFTWDLNQSAVNSSNDIHKSNRLFHMPGLMRFRLTPDQSKMIISTTCGYLIMIHNLDLSTLADDLLGFRPNLYRIMQAGPQIFSNVSNFDHLFSKEQRINRVEFITDFPDTNDPEIISALQIHPDGWCALSRNVNHNESSEWTCLHDIQDVYENDDSDDDDEEKNYYGNDIDIMDGNSSALSSNNTNRLKRKRKNRRNRKVNNNNNNNRNSTGASGASTTAGNNRNVDYHDSAERIAERARVARQASIIRQIRRIYPREDSNRIGNLVHIVSSGMVEPVRVIRARVQNTDSRQQFNDDVREFMRMNRNRDNDDGGGGGSGNRTTGENAPGQGARFRGAVRRDDDTSTPTEQPPDLWSAELTVRHRVNRNSFPNQPFSQINLYTFNSGIVAPNDEQLRKILRSRRRRQIAQRRLRHAMESRRTSSSSTSAGGGTSMSTAANINDSDNENDSTDDENVADQDDIDDDSDDDDDDDGSDGLFNVDEDDGIADDDDDDDDADDDEDITNNIRNIVDANQRPSARRDNGGSSNSDGRFSLPVSQQHLNALYANIDDVYDNDALFHPRRSARRPAAAPQQPVSWIKRTKPRPIPRMICYIQESSKAKHFIKEMCFSADGRIIGSPYRNGVRLLGFSSDCIDLQSALGAQDGKRPFPLTEIKYLPTHSTPVVCAKFSPKSMLLATGCLGGRVAWYNPVF